MQLTNKMLIRKYHYHKYRYLQIRSALLYNLTGNHQSFSIMCSQSIPFTRWNAPKIIRVRFRERSVERKFSKKILVTSMILEKIIKIIKFSTSLPLVSFYLGLKLSFFICKLLDKVKFCISFENKCNLNLILTRD